ncbi:cysteine dioxygenase [Umezawaea tangerina]|uniref:Cysteine dioxygenase type I n=1 Tax=Umezawaea tangerina TaxID=84725 RepID=A0A2T0TB16_9PSEU|nr:cysteine dioxygenase family protein [Umezawaea tangerina]PRY42862.1 Cysteine dioxygenase type I [Umezawaea tangerina]
MTSTLALADLHPELDVRLVHDIIHPERELWSPRQLRDLTSFVASELTTPLLDILDFDPSKRWWARLGLTEGVELWLLSWLPGQGTEPHDHGGSSGSFTVLKGELTENYRYPAGPIRSAKRPVGASLGFGSGRAHEVHNLGTTGAASVHAYSPPLIPTREYASLADIPAEIPPLPAQRLPLDQLRVLADLEGP